jgi:hypothetical protein
VFFCFVYIRKSQQIVRIRRADVEENVLTIAFIP